MSQTWFLLLAIAFLVVVVFFISVLLELRKSARALTEFLRNTEASLKPALEEFQLSLRSLRKITDDINEVTEDIKTVSDSVRGVSQNFYKISSLINEVSSDALIKVSGLRVAIRTALEVLLNNILKKGGSR